MLDVFGSTCASGARLVHRSLVRAGWVAQTALVAGSLCVAACEGRPSAPQALAKATAPAQSRVEVTENGFEPSRVLVRPDQPLIFRRTTTESCATALLFPEFGIEKALPLNTDVSIALPATASGELAFQCGVGANRGKVVARLAGS